MALFLIGLLIGLAQQRFANTRMALATHLEGVMNGTFLLADLERGTALAACKRGGLPDVVFGMVGIGYP